MSTPAGMAPLLTVPYVSVAEFKANPTWLDLDDLIEGGTASQQNAELYNQLLKASAWADNFVRQPIKAHYMVENLRCRVDQWGRIKVHPSHNPVRYLAAVSYGADLNNMQQVTLGVGSAWVEDQRGLVVVLSGITGAWAGQLQFGAAPSYSTEVYVQVEYVAGYGNGALTAATAVGATSVTLDDVTGFQVPATSLAGTSYGGSVARIWTPGSEEAVRVSAVASASNQLTFSSTLANAHSVGDQVSEIPADIRQAVVQYACGLLLRQNVTDDLPFPGSPGPSARRSSARGVAGGLITEGERLLCPYKRVR